MYELPMSRREEARREYERNPWGVLLEESGQVDGLSPPGDEPLFKSITPSEMADCLERVYSEASKEINEAGKELRKQCSADKVTTLFDPAIGHTRLAEFALWILGPKEIQGTQRAKAHEPNPAVDKAAWWQNRWPHCQPAKPTAADRCFPRKNWA